MRIVSLLPASTELIFALGLGENLVGRSHECDFPAKVLELPALTRAKFDDGRASGQINRDVTGLLEKGLSVYEVDADLLKTLQPDVIITQSQCEACAVDYDAIEKAATTFLNSEPQIVDLQPDDLGKVWEDFRKVGRAAGKLEKANKLIAEMMETMEHIHQKAMEDQHTPGVGLIEWLDPLMNAGNWMPEFVKLANGSSKLTGINSKTKSHFIEIEDLIEIDPETIILMPCGYSIDHTLREMNTIKGMNGWNRLKAVRNGKVFVADGNQYFNRPGPRLTESLRILAEILHPDQFEPLFEREGWIRI